MKDAILKGLGMSVCLGAATSAASAALMDVVITVENLASANGTHQTPFWVGLHNGGYDFFNAGSSASSALERLAEDGNVNPLRAQFAGAGGTASTPPSRRAARSRRATSPAPPSPSTQTTPTTGISASPPW
mgnify:CR=1 FL=1